MIAICALGWNHWQASERWLASLKRNSTGHDVALYLMDNGSTDGDRTYQTFRDAKPQVLLRNVENESIYRGWNRLADSAFVDGADIIILSNNDVVCGPGWLDPIAKNLVPGCKRYFLPNGGGPDLSVHSAQFDAICRQIADQNRDKVIPARAGWCLCFHREAVPLFSPIPEELQLWYGDDWIHWKLAKAGYRCEGLMDSVCFHATSTSFYSRSGYDQIVAKDLEVYKRLTEGA